MHKTPKLRHGNRHMFASMANIFKTNGLKGFYQGFVPAFLLYSMMSYKALVGGILGRELPPEEMEFEFTSEEDEGEGEEGADD